MLGGHDHLYKIDGVVQAIKKEEWKKEDSEEKIVPVIKSGTDFKEFTEVNVTFDTDQAVFVDVTDGVKEEDPDFNQENPKVFKKVTDGEEMSLLMHSEDNQLMVHASRIFASEFEPQKEILDHEREYVKKFEQKLSGHIGWSAADLDLREDVIRTQESTFGNFVADLLRTEFYSDVALINTGAF